MINEDTPTLLEEKKIITILLIIIIKINIKIMNTSKKLVCFAFQLMFIYIFDFIGLQKRQRKQTYIKKKSGNTCFNNFGLTHDCLLVYQKRPNKES